MRIEKIYKKEDGTKYKVTVDFYTTSFNQKWDVTAEVCQPGKRKFTPIVNENDYRYRALSMEDRVKFAHKKLTEHIPVEWIRETQMELVEKIRESITDLEL